MFCGHKGETLAFVFKGLTAESEGQVLTEMAFLEVWFFASDFCPHSPPL